MSNKIKQLVHQYELMVLLPAQLDEGESEATLNAIRTEIKNKDGAITQDKMWGRRKLAYPIKGTSTGLYQLLVFTLPATATKGLETMLRLHQNILRHHLAIYSAKKRANRMIQRPLADTTPASQATTTLPIQELSSEELDKKLDQILEETGKTL